MFSEWPLDGIIELLQKYLHAMNFPPTIVGYKNHSGCLMFYYRSLLFATSKYYRLQSAKDIQAKFAEENNLVDNDLVKEG